jgi:hypothetical protein
MALTIPNTFVNGTPAIATEVNANFTAVKTEVDLKIDSTIVDAKGDLIVATAADTVARQAVGSNGQVLVADSGVTNGVAWVDPQTNRNVIINGAMQVAQRGTSTASITTNGYYTADRWATNNATLGTWTQSQEADAPTGSGFRNSLKMLCTTADASPAAADFLNVNQRFEGQNLQQFLKGTASAKQFAVSFWVKSNVTGTYIAELIDNDNTRQVSASYTISVSATWEKKTIIFPADTTGAFDNDNALSLNTIFYLAAGSDRTSGTLQTTWATTVNANRAVGQTNLAAATNNYWQITGVQLEAGSVATPFEFEDISDTLTKCQRYYYRTTTAVIQGRFGPTGAFVSTTQALMTVQHPTTMRAGATSVEGNLLAVYDYNTEFPLTAFTFASAWVTPQATLLSGTVASGGTQYRPVHLTSNNSTVAYFAVSAEL